MSNPSHYCLSELRYPDAQDSFFYLALLLGWLNKVEIDAESLSKIVYAFLHLSFEKYFATLVEKDIAALAVDKEQEN